MSKIKQYGKVAMTFDGTFDVLKSYERLCVVDYNGLNYVSIVDNTTNNPTDTTQWRLLSTPGPQGPRGQQGAKGDPGINGRDGVNGVDGKNGKDGKDGDAAIPTITVMVFRTYVPSIGKPTPDRPEGGYWDYATNAITYPAGWGPSDNLERPVWMSTKTFSTIPERETPWSNPIQISGSDGLNGADGVATEFIFKLTKTEAQKPSDQDIANLPITATGVAPSGWTDAPTGVSEEYQCEYCCTRKKDSEGNWSAWDGPALWGKYGVNGIDGRDGADGADGQNGADGNPGKDGSGVDFIYWLDPNNTATPPANPTPPDFENNEEYQDFYGEYCPEELGWTDNPKGTSKQYQYEWVAVRKYKNGKWGAFSEPTLWSNFGLPGTAGENGFMSRTRYAVTQSSGDVPEFNPNNINPGSIWGDFPTNYDKLNDVVWAIDAIVYLFEEKLAPNQQWVGPRIVTGIAGVVDVPVNYNSTIFTLSESRPDAPQVGIDINTVNQGLVTSTNASGETVTWQDYPTSEGQWWQTVAKVNGSTGKVISFGSVMVWNGRDNDAVAVDGKYWDRYIAASDNYETEPPIAKTSVNPNTGLSKSIWVKVNANVDPPTVPEGGAMWETMALFNPDGTFAASGWCSPYRISGERGPKGDTGPTGPIGPTGPGGLSGVPGVSYEERYMKGTEKGPMITWNNVLATQRDPANWYTTIPDTDSTNLYVWCIKARIIRTNNSDYTGRLEDSWEGPFRISGLNGTPGIDAPATIVCTLTNPTDVIICDEEGNTKVGLPVTTFIQLYAGGEEIDFESFGYEVLDEARSYITVQKMSGGGIRILKINNDAPRSITIKLWAKVSGSDVEYSQLFTIKRVLTSDLPVQADLLNENVTVPASSTGEIHPDYRNIENAIKLYIGDKEFIPEEFYLSDSKGNVKNYTGVTLNKLNISDGGIFKVLVSDDSFSGDVCILYLTAKITYNDIDYTKVVRLRIVKAKAGVDGTGAVWYEVKSNYHNFVRDKEDNTITPDELLISVVKHETDKDPVNLTYDDLLGLGYSLAITVDGEKTYSLGELYINISQLKDFEENLLIELKKGNTIIDFENLPVLVNGINGVTPTTYDLITNVDVIQYDENDQLVVPSDVRFVYCNINMKTKDGIRVIKTKDDFDQYCVGYDFKIIVDGKELTDITFGSNIYVQNINQYIQFELWNVEQEPDMLWDYKAIRVQKTLVGEKGDRGQLIYPAGVYNVNALYETNDKVAPYVFDTLDNKFYVLNAKMKWVGTKSPDREYPNDVLEQNGQYPSTNYNGGNNTSAVWVPFEMFEAIYADIGMFNQALVGSAVFWKDYMFSQQGVDGNGNITSRYDLFNPDNPFADGNLFYPNICFNFKTGETWLGKNKFNIDKNGNIKLGGWEVNQNIITSTLNDGNRIMLMADGTIKNIIDETDKVNYALYPDGSAHFAGTNIKLNPDGTGEFAGWKFDYSQLVADTDLNNPDKEFIIHSSGLIINKDKTKTVPNYSLFADGSAHFSKGKVKFAADGSGSIGSNGSNACIKWDADGVVEIGLGESKTIFDPEKGVICNALAEKFYLTALSGGHPDGQIDGTTVYYSFPQNVGINRHFLITDGNLKTVDIYFTTPDYTPDSYGFYYLGEFNFVSQAGDKTINFNNVINSQFTVHNGSMIIVKLYKFYGKTYAYKVSDSYVG